MTTRQTRLAIIGGGIVGVATAHALRETLRGDLIVLEAEPRLAAHQTGRNSGVIHSGLYYKPGSLKARLCVEGREAMYRFCGEHDIPHERCGKLVVATTEEEAARLDALQERGRTNGLHDLRRLPGPAIREYEPHAAGLAALLVPETGIVHYPDVVRALSQEVRDAGAQIETGARVQRVLRRPSSLIIETAQGSFEASALICCAGLHADRVARMCGLDPGVAIVPFRGEYYDLRPGRRHLVRNLIYPVPDPRLPFLGVHFTRRIAGGVEAGPNAVLALKREGYRWSDVSLRDVASLARFAGAWRMASRLWRVGVGEYWRSFSTHAFVTALQHLVPEITPSDVYRAGSGVRAQAVDPEGRLVDDFHIVEGDRMIHVLNAPSPAATASITIGKTIAGMAVRRFGWN